MLDVAYHEEATYANVDTNHHPPFESHTADTNKGGNFLILPQRAIFDPRLSDRTKVVLAALASYANKDRVCIVAQATLAKRLGTQRQRINACIVDLATYGYLEIYHRGAEGRRGRGSNGYRLLFDSRGFFVTPGGHKYPFESQGNDTNTPDDTDLSPSERSQIFVSQKTGYLSPSGRTALTVPSGTVPVKREEISDVSVPEADSEQHRDARARAPEDLATDLRANLTTKHERRELWQRVIGVLNVPKSQRQEWLDPCTLYEPTTHNFLLVAPTRGVKQFVDMHWGVAIWCELQKMQHAECELALDYGAPPNAKQRSISA